MMVMPSDPAPRTDETTTLSKDDVRVIRCLHDQWIAKEAGGDTVGVLDLCTDDVQWLVPEAGLLVGKAAARDLLTQPGVEIREIETADVQIRGSGIFAFKTSAYRTHYASGSESDGSVMTGTHLWILRKADGEWRVVFVTWQPTLDWAAH
jgi:ketosteroid isomerase-like protein